MCYWEPQADLGYLLVACHLCAGDRACLPEYTSVVVSAPESLVEKPARNKQRGQTDLCRKQGRLIATAMGKKNG